MREAIDVVSGDGRLLRTADGGIGSGPGQDDAFAASHRDAVVVNAGAYTAVDAAETDTDRAFQVNAVGPGLVAASCAEHGVPLLHVSTDYVFPGTA